MAAESDLDRRAKMEPFDQALSTFLQTLDADGTRITYQSAVAKAFKETAGQTVWEHTRIVHFDQGVATAVMDSGIWAQELAILADEYRVKMNALLGGDIVTDVVFRTRPMR
jgi:predicted nucleic acid-binding Zn ribbon protein